MSLELELESESLLELLLLLEESLLDESLLLCEDELDFGDDFLAFFLFGASLSSLLLKSNQIRSG